MSSNVVIYAQQYMVSFSIKPLFVYSHNHCCYSAGVSEELQLLDTVYLSKFVLKV